MGGGGGGGGGGFQAFSFIVNGFVLDIRSWFGGSRVLGLGIGCGCVSLYVEFGGKEREREREIEGKKERKKETKMTTTITMSADLHRGLWLRHGVPSALPLDRTALYSVL